MRLTKHKVRRYTGERYREIVEALEFGIWQGNFVQDERDLLTCIEATGKLQALAQAEFESIRDFMSVLLTPKRKILERCLASQHVVPVDSIGDFFDLLGRLPVA